MSNLPSSTREERHSTSDVIDAGYQHLRSSVTTSFRYLDIAAATLLSIATLATAWCAYQSTRWGGVQATSFAEASSLRIQAGYQSNLARTVIDHDTATLIESISAQSAGDPALLSDVLDNLIRSRSDPYLDQLIESQLPSDPSSASGEQSTPNENTSYVKNPTSPSAELIQQSQWKFLEATNANQTGDDYMLATVLFASVLSFAGVSTKFDRVKIQGALVCVGLMMLTLGVLQIAELPVH